MDVERVKRYVMSALILTVSFLFAGGVGALGMTSDQPGAQPVLLGIAGLVGVLAIIGTRVLTQRPILTPALILGLIPAVAAWLTFR